MTFPGDGNHAITVGVDKDTVAQSKQSEFYHLLNNRTVTIDTKHHQQMFQAVI